MARHEPQPLSVSQRRAQDDIALANGGRQRLTLVSAFAQQVGVEAFDVDPAAYGRLVRVLFTCRPADGHYYPMVPLIEALVGAGDDVAVATAEPLLGFVGAAGVPAFSAGLAGDDPIVLHHRNFAAGLPADRDPTLRVHGNLRGRRDATAPRGSRRRLQGVPT